MTQLPDFGFDLRPMTQGQFRRFQRFVQTESGIRVSDQKKELLTARVGRRVRDLGLRDFGSYWRRIEHDPRERVRLLDRVTTNETRFFREPRQFEFLERSVCPRLEDDRVAGRRLARLRVWSAGCSTGEEPFSLAMVLLASLPSWKIDIMATDISRRALKQARRATWDLEEAADIPLGHRRRFMLRGVRSQVGRLRAGPEIRRIVRFEHHNLQHPVPPRFGVFDLVFCRNVMIYFDSESCSRVVQRLLSTLCSTGYLFLGHSESLVSLEHRVRSVSPSVYVPTEGTSSGIGP